MQIGFKPQLLPNEPAGIAPDWEARLNPIQAYSLSNKLDGARVELEYDVPAKGRSLKVIPSIDIQRMHKEFCDVTGNFAGILEAEFYSTEMNFAEIMHFFRCSNITSDKERNKLQKLWDKTEAGQYGFLKGAKFPMEYLHGKDLQDATKWDFPGRTVDWLCTWHASLKFYVFDYLPLSNYAKIDRYEIYREMVIDANCPHVNYIRQTSVDHIDKFYQMYDQAMMDGHEGLVAIKSDSRYKKGRITLNSGEAYKAKENKLEWDGVIIGVEEGTVAREGASKTTNELGRSVTSKLKEDRVPGGFCKGFKVRMDDGNELTVSLNGYNHREKELLLDTEGELIGQWILFTGMKPVKEGGVPRHAQFTKGNFRDEK